MTDKTLPEDIERLYQQLELLRDYSRAYKYIVIGYIVLNFCFLAAMVTWIITR